MSEIERTNLANKFGAEIINVEATREECLERLERDKDRVEVKDEWREYIDKFFAQKEIYEAKTSPGVS